MTSVTKQAQGGASGLILCTCVTRLDRLNNCIHVHHKPVLRSMIFEHAPDCSATVEEYDF